MRCAALTRDRNREKTLTMMTVNEVNIHPPLLLLLLNSRDQQQVYWGGAVGQIGHSQYQELDKMSSANPTEGDEEWILNPLKRVTMNADKVTTKVKSMGGKSFYPLQQRQGCWPKYTRMTIYRRRYYLAGHNNSTYSRVWLRRATEEAGTVYLFGKPTPPGVLYLRRPQHSRQQKDSQAGRERERGRV